MSIGAFFPLGVDDGLGLALSSVFATWVGLSGFVVGSRALHDARLRGSRARRRRARTRGDGALAVWRRAEEVRAFADRRDPAGVQALEDLLAGSDEEVAAAAVTMLGEVDDEQAVTVLVRALQTGACSPAWVAAQLERHPTPTDRLLRPLLRDARPTVRAWAARLLAASSRADSLEDDLAILCSDPDPDVRAAAVQSLGAVGGELAAECASTLLRDPVWYVRVQAARTLGQLQSTKDAAAVAALLSDTEWWVRTAAKDAFVSLGRSAADALLPLLEHPDRFAQNGAAEILQDLGVVRELVGELASGSPPSTQALAARALLGRIFEAGGPRVRKAALAGCAPETRKQLEALFGPAELVREEAA